MFLSSQWYKRLLCFKELSGEKGMSTDKKKTIIISNIYIPQIAMKIAKNTVPPLSNRWVTWKG